MKKEQFKLKVKRHFDRLLKSSLEKEFLSITEGIQEAIIEKYDEELVDVVTDRDSKTNPNFYRAEFIERLESFEYWKNEGGKLKLVTPDMENFNFSGRLKVIETIMHGVSGVYMEVNEEDYIAIFNKRPINEDPLDEYVPPKERIYLVRYTPKLRKAERDLNKRFVRYPFSNTPPIDIFSAGERFVNENIGGWFKNAIKLAQKEFVNNYKGANL
jgi:hypothetical protein